MKRKAVVRLTSWILCMVMTLFIFAGSAYAKSEESKPLTLDDLEIIATEMEADGVYNTGGFGGLMKMRYNETIGVYEPSTACALINRNGESIFPYTETGYQYYVNGDYISLAYKDAFTLSAIGQKSPKYYRFSGDKIEELATNLYTGTPMINGFAVGYDAREDIWQGGNAHMIDANNQTVYSFPEAFNTLIGYGGGPSFSSFYTENSIACISDGIIGCYVRGDYGSLVSAFYTDYQGNKIIELPEVTGISAFSEGRAAVRKSGLWGYIDTEGQMIVDHQYTAAGDFCDGMAYVRDTTGKFGYINQSGEVVIPLEYDDAKGAGDGLAAVAKEKKYGLINYQNQVVVPLEYDDISSFVDGVAYAVKEGKVYIIRVKEESTPKQFDDVKNPNAWYYETVYKIASTMNANGKPLMSGYGDGSKFGPADPLTRQDFAVILYRLADEPDVEPIENPFKDTNPKGYYYTCVVWAKANDVIAGYNDGRFGVGDKITREQVATILYRFAKDYMNLPASEKGDLTKFKDGNAISSWAKEALTWATGSGVITGKDNGTRIDARGNAARAEIGAMILRFIDYMNKEPETIKVGLICAHDENASYDLHFINGFKEACEAEGVEYVIRTNIGETVDCYNTAVDLVDQGCTLIFADSFGHEDYMIQAAKEYPNVQFCHAGGTKAHTERLNNYANGFAAIYEGRFLAGVAAGMKLNEMIAAGKITADQAKMGYVGAFTYAEVISGYSAFYLGAKSVCPTVTMDVTFTGSWYDPATEQLGAETLIKRGCVLISQHSDSLGAPTACENAGVPNVSYNGSTKAAGPNTYLISSGINWAPYYQYAIQCVKAGKNVDTDWTGTIKTGSVQLYELNDAVAAAGTADAIEAAKAKLLSGERQVFDTATFTVQGKTITSYMADVDSDLEYEGDTEVIIDGAFAESKFRSAPYFDLQIDGITLLDVAF